METGQAAEVILVSQRILRLRDQPVILDADLAGLYGVTTKALLQAVRRNQSRFPADFVFQINELEWSNLRSQFGDGLGFSVDGVAGGIVPGPLRSTERSRPPMC